MTDGQWEVVQDNLGVSQSNVLAGVDAFDPTQSFSSRVEVYYIPEATLQVYINGKLGYEGVPIIAASANAPHTGMSVLVTSGTSAAGSLAARFADIYADIFLPL
jgi:hypothetical protein